jgi:hypothetical protein
MAQSNNVFIDIIRGKHLAGTPEQLLDRRRLTWSKEYGWVYDVWAEDAHKYSQAGAYGRCGIRCSSLQLYAMHDQGHGHDKPPPIRACASVHFQREEVGGTEEGLR